MAKRKNGSQGDLNVGDYRHSGAKRKNNPPAKIASEGNVPSVPKTEYYYSPRRPPALQFDPDGKPDHLSELLATASERKLADDEIKLLAEALRTQEPWLEWAGKREKRKLLVDPVALHIHERVSAQAILKVAARQDVQRGLFADPEQDYHEAVQFYRHDIDWTNRMILGDSLQVMTSLTRREDLAGKVQMIYIDPPYGIKFSSNFQPEIIKRDVTDKEQDLTREPEMVKAYRDTWQLGLHSYLSYLRDRLIAAKDLLAPRGSIFVQIGEENVHRVRTILDEVFGQEQFISQISVFKTTTPRVLLDNNLYYLLWYAKSIDAIKYRQVFSEKELSEWTSETKGGSWGVTINGIDRSLEPEEKANPKILPPNSKVYQLTDLSSAGQAQEIVIFDYQDEVFEPRPKSHWKTTLPGLKRLAKAGRVESRGGRPWFKKYHSDFPVRRMTNAWTDTSGKATERFYVVQTQEKVIDRCILMTTDPGDLVLDPTCGSGTTALIAEQRGRRWITIDTSRVALAIARQRLLTAKFDYYKLREINEEDRQKNSFGAWLSDSTGQIKGPCTFRNKTVPHITLKSIAQNTSLDPIFAKHDPTLEDRLVACNQALNKVSAEQRTRLQRKLLDKQKAGGKKSITDADRRRWDLPKQGEQWQHWQIPTDTDVDWPQALSDAVTAYQQAWRAKMKEVSACIDANAEQEELLDKPETVKGIVRVSGPFTVESVLPAEISLLDEGLFDGTPDEIGDSFEFKNIEAYLDQMTRLLRMDGVRFPNNKENVFTRLERLTGQDGGIHAEGRWINKGEADADPEGKADVAVAFGPQYGPVTSKQVEDLIRMASRRGYDDLVIAGFSFDGPAQMAIQEASHPKLRVHIAHIRPDINPGMNGLLKDQPGSQLFTVFGQPRTQLNGPDGNGEYTVVMEGVDIYDPLTNTIRSVEDSKVAAWFIDGDYDARAFCITQAFFPDKSAWEKLSKALNGAVDAERFEALSGTKSLPFPPGKHRCVAVKVIDPRGNEVMQVHKLR